jgi:hypothetical protein
MELRTDIKIFQTNPREQFLMILSRGVVMGGSRKQDQKQEQSSSSSSRNRHSWVEQNLRR